MDVRVAAAEDLLLLEGIEDAADQMFVDLFGATDWPPPTSGERRAEQPGFVLVVGRPVFGFAHVLEIDGEAHLEQLAVHPAHQRAGAGTALVHAAMAEAARRGHASLSLRTYLDVPWNAPFYATLGFVVDTPETAFQRRLIAQEEAENLMAHGSRVLMRVGLGAD